MSTHTIFGAIADKAGGAVTTDEYGRRQYISCPSTSYRRVQSHVGVRVDHQGAEVGRVEHLELWDDPQRQLVAVASVTLDDDDLTGDWYWSPTIRFDDDAGALDLVELSLTQSPATVGLRPLTIRCGDVRYAWARRGWDLRSNRLERMLTLAGEAADQGRQDQPILVRTDTSSTRAVTHAAAPPARYATPHATVRRPTRSAAGGIPYDQLIGPIRHGPVVTNGILRVS